MFSLPPGKSEANTVKQFLQELSVQGEDNIQKKIFNSRWPSASTKDDEATKYLQHLTSNAISVGGITNLSGNIFHYLALHNVTDINNAPIFTAHHADLKYNYSEALYFAAIRLALSLNIDINAIDTHPFFQQPALCHAIAFDNILIAKALIVEGRDHIDVNRASIQPTWAATPLILAIQRGHHELTKLLSNHSHIDLNKPDAKGLTPLHWAAIMLDFETLQLLITKGANPHIINAHGMLARDYLFPDLNPKDYLEKVIYNLTSVMDKRWSNCLKFTRPDSWLSGF